MIINQNITESDKNNLDIKPQLEHQNQIQEKKDSGRFFDIINSVRLRFYKNGELNSSSYVKIPLSSNAILN